MRGRRVADAHPVGRKVRGQGDGAGGGIGQVAREQEPAVRGAHALRADLVDGQPDLDLKRLAPTLEADRAAWRHQDDAALAQVRRRDAALEILQPVLVDQGVAMDADHAIGGRQVRQPVLDDDPRRRIGGVGGAPEEIFDQAREGAVGEPVSVPMRHDVRAHQANGLGRDAERAAVPGAVQRVADIHLVHPQIRGGGVAELEPRGQAGQGQAAHLQRRGHALVLEPGAGQSPGDEVAAGDQDQDRHRQHSRDDEKQAPLPKRSGGRSGNCGHPASWMRWVSSAG